MRTIWKYTLDLREGPQSISIPYESNVLVHPHFDVQYGKISFWAEVNTDRDPQEYVFHVFGTGWEIPKNVDYLGTVLMHNGSYVWHIYLEQT